MKRKDDLIWKKVQQKKLYSIITVVLKQIKNVVIMDYECLRPMRKEPEKGLFKKRVLITNKFAAYPKDVKENSVVKSYRDNAKETIQHDDAMEDSNV